MTPSALGGLLATPTFAVRTGTALAFLFAGGLAMLTTRHSRLRI
jgi:hypothetical protein